MDFNDLKKLINGLSKQQRTTEVCVFEEGTSRYIWPSSLEDTSGPRPFLEGVAAEGDRKVEFFDPNKAKGTKSRDVDSVQPHPSELDGPVEMKNDRVRAPRPTGLDSSVRSGRSASQVRNALKKGDKTDRKEVSEAEKIYGKKRRKPGK